MMNLDLLSHKDVFMNALVEKVDRHSTWAKDLAEPMGCKKKKDQ